MTTREIKKKGYQGKKEECRGRKGVRERNVSRKEGHQQLEGVKIRKEGRVSRKEGRKEGHQERKEGHQGRKGGHQ